jgi:predicted N-acetyltransferase YhbS
MVQSTGRTMLTDEQQDQVKDITRLISSEVERRAFLDMLAHKLRGRELADSELRRVAERTWREFLGHGRPNSHGPGDVA